jgi:hypothetical protein
MKDRVFFDPHIIIYDMLETYNRAYPGQRMRVVFLVENEYLWDKQKPIYDALLQDGSADAFVVLLPSCQTENAGSGQRSGYYDVRYWNFFHENYADVYDFTNVMDLHLLAPDYIFLARPYEELRQIRGTRTAELARIAKLCYTDYGVPGTKFFLRAWAEKTPFYSHLSFLFCNSTEEKNAMEAAHSYASAAGLQHFEALGYPAHETYLAYTARHKKKRRVLWTPRWEKDGPLGGSHFLAYKDSFVEFAARHRSDALEFAVRPHPLMFDHLIVQGSMTEEEVQGYKSILADYGVELDEGQYTLFDALTSADILLTDFSSINMNFFLLDRPLIYCPHDPDLTEDYAKMAEASYTADTWDEAAHWLERLISGEDPLAPRRRELVHEFRAIHIGAAKRIVQRLKQDYADSAAPKNLILPELEQWIFSQKKDFVPLLLHEPSDMLAHIRTQEWYEGYLALLPLRVRDENLQWGMHEILSVLKTRYAEAKTREQRSCVVLAMLLFADPLMLPVPIETDLWPDKLYDEIREVFHQRRREVGIV